MEPLAPFELETVRRDWIEGLSGDAFLARVEGWWARIERSVARGSSGDGLQNRNGFGSFLYAGTPEASPRLVVCESDPIEFAAVFLAGAWSGIPVVLANGNWAATERRQFDQLMVAGSPPPGSILIPTGGTTGGVKLAIHDWASLRAAVQGLHRFLGGGPIHSCCVLPMYHVSGLMPLLRSLLTGGRIRFDDRETKGYSLSLVPTQLQRAFGDAAILSRIEAAERVFVGGAGIPAALAAETRRRGLPIVPVYGMTETAAMVAAVPADAFLGETEAGAVPIGDAQFEITETGQLRIQSPALFKGYYGVAPVDLSMGFLTGDRGRIDKEGGLHVLGRVDELILTGGEKVDPREVAQVLCQLDGVTAAQVVGEADKEWGQTVAAYISGPAASRPPGILEEALRLRLAPHKRPKRILPMEAMPPPALPEENR